MYIGATLQEVRAAIRSGMIRPVCIEPPREVRQLDMRGAGTKPLRKTMARRLIPRWWNGGAGTKLVVGYLHSVKGLVPIAVTRPVLTALYRPTLQEMISEFSEVLESEILELKDRNLISLDGVYGEYPDPVYESYSNNIVLRFQLWNDENSKTLLRRRVRARRRKALARPGERIFPNNNNNGCPHILTTLFVWPAGIIKNQAMSNATNKFHTSAMNFSGNRERASASRMQVARDPKTPNALRNRILGPSRQVVRRYTTNLRARRARFANLMGELRVVPRGALHPAFPGGSNYLASLARLEAMAATDRKNLKRKRPNAP